MRGGIRRALQLRARIAHSRAPSRSIIVSCAGAGASLWLTCQANALFCRGLLDRDAARLLAAAARYQDASRPLRQAKALEAAAGHFVDADNWTQARAAFTTAVDVYTSLGAAADVARLQAEFRAHGIRRGLHAKHRQELTADSLHALSPSTTSLASPRTHNKAI